MVLADKLLFLAPGREQLLPFAVFLAFFALQNAF